MFENPRLTSSGCAVALTRWTRAPSPPVFVPVSKSAARRFSLAARRAATARRCREAAEARERREASRQEDIGIYGGDIDPDVLALSVRNLARAGFSDIAPNLVCRDVAHSQAPEPIPGLLVTNPPYGTRLADESRADAATRSLGDVLRRRYLGWTAWVLVGRPRQARALGLKPAARHPIWNGRLDARLLEVPISSTPPKGGPRGR